VTNVPAFAPRGGTVSFDVKNLNLTSLGSPENTTLHIALDGGADLGDVKVSAGDPKSTTMANGTATVSFTVPQDAPDASTIVLTAAPSGTVVRVPLHVTPGAPSSPPSSADESAQTPETEGGITVPDKVYHPGDSIVISVPAAQPGEFVSAWLWSTPQNLGGWLQVAADGTVTTALPATLAAGQHRIVVQDTDGNVLGWTTITVQATPPAGGGAGSGGTAGSTSNGVTGGLASTGSDGVPALLGASALLILGAGLVVALRRRSRRA
jgi:5'-nucleotidase